MEWDRQIQACNRTDEAWGGDRSKLAVGHYLRLFLFWSWLFSLEDIVNVLSVEGIDWR